MFRFEYCNLVHKYMIRGRGVVQGLRPCREVNSHRREFCFRPLVLCAEAYVLGKDFGVGLRCLFLVVAPRCLGSMELFSKFVASGLFSDQILLERRLGMRWYCGHFLLRRPMLRA